MGWGDGGGIILCGLLGNLYLFGLGVRLWVGFYHWSDFFQLREGHDLVTKVGHFVVEDSLALNQVRLK